MPFDAYLLSGVTEELQSAVGAKIDKVQQPTRDTVLLSIRIYGGNRKLYISANPNHARVQYTDLSFENPAQPPMFCMLLRKHLVGARILSLTQQPMERLVIMELEGQDELGADSRKYLIAELMGRNSNLILTDGEKRIIDCLRRVDLEMSETRQVLPGLYYHEPPEQDKCDPRGMTADDFRNLLESVKTPTRVAKLLQQSLNGVSPLLCREMSCLICGATDGDVMDIIDPAAAANTLVEFFRKPMTPTLLLENGTPKEFTCVPITQYGDFLEQRSYPDYRTLLDEYYGKRERSERQRQRAQTLQKTVTTHRDRVRRKLALQQKELNDSLDRETLRRNADLVMANLHKIRKGDILLTTEDFYDPEMKETTVRLLPHLSAQQNAARYYKEYTKAKNAEKILTEQIVRGETELSYLNSVLEELARAETDRDLTEIRAELVAQNYVRETDRKKQMKQPASKPMEFTSSSGWTILVGRNNRQNDQLTLKMAGKQDIWLHVQKIHGSHVIILCGNTNPDDQTMTEAAQLAAWFSEAREGQNVAVDTVRVKHVRKPVGALPGMVIYDHYNTLYVTPKEELTEWLRKKERR